MKAILQRVKTANVCVNRDFNNQKQRVEVGRIDFGWLILLGVCEDDTEDSAKKLATKCVTWRGLPDHSIENGKISKSILDLSGSILVVSQFTLYASTSKGRRPSFNHASKGEHARDLYDVFCRCLKDAGVERVECGAFGEEMYIESECWGPVTYTLET